MNNYQRIIYNILVERPIAFHPGIARALGSVKAGVFMCQLLYWHGKGRFGDWTYKTIPEVNEETALSRKEQDSAIRISVAKGVLEVKRKGIPQRRHFKVNIEKLVELISNMPERRKLNCPQDAGFTVPMGQTPTENTEQEITSDITSFRRRNFEKSWTDEELKRKKAIITSKTIQ